MLEINLSVFSSHGMGWDGMGIVGWDVEVTRAGQHHGVIVLPEGLIQSFPEVKALLQVRPDGAWTDSCMGGWRDGWMGRSGDLGDGWMGGQVHG